MQEDTGIIDFGREGFIISNLSFFSLAYVELPPPPSQVKGQEGKRQRNDVRAMFGDNRFSKRLSRRFAFLGGYLCVIQWCIFIYAYVFPGGQIWAC